MYSYKQYSITVVTHLIQHSLRRLFLIDWCWGLWCGLVYNLQVGLGETERSHDDRYYLVLFRLVIYIYSDKINIKTIYTTFSYNQYSITVVSNFISTSIKMFWVLIWMLPIPSCRLILKKRSWAFQPSATKRRKWQLRCVQAQHELHLTATVGRIMNRLID